MYEGVRWMEKFGDWEHAERIPVIDTGRRAERAAFGGALPRFGTNRVGPLELPGPELYRAALRPLDATGADVRIAGVTLTSVE